MPQLIYQKELVREAEYWRAEIVEFSSDGMRCFALDAPCGYRWLATRKHRIWVWWHAGDKKGCLEATEDALARLSYGLEECPNPDCRWCEGALEDLLEGPLNGTPFPKR